MDEPVGTTEVKWYDGLYGGLLAGIVTALFHIGWESWVTHEGTFTSFFAPIAQALLGPFGATPNAWVIAFGITLHLLGSAAAGIVYALVAIRVGQMWHFPFSTMFGVSYGLALWLILHDILVPLLRITDTQQLVEGIIGTTLFYGLWISEYLTVAHHNSKPEPVRAP